MDAQLPVTCYNTSMKLIAGSSNLPLAQHLARELHIELLDVERSTFANGEKRIWIKDPVHGENVILVQSFSYPVDEHIIETLLMVDALERLGVRHINVVVPWMGYSFQDKVFRDGEPIAAKVIADLLSNAHIKRVFLLDLHNTSIPGFFSVPTQHITAMPLFAQYLEKNFPLSEAVIVSPDFGGLKRSRMFAQKLRLPMANVDKQRDLYTAEVTSVALQGTVRDKIAFLMDDAILTGGTAVEVAKLLKQEGAKQVHFLSTHGIFAGSALEKLDTNVLDSVIITDSVHHEHLPDHIKVLQSAPLFADVLKAWM